MQSKVTRIQVLVSVIIAFCLEVSYLCDIRLKDSMIKYKMKKDDEGILDYTLCEHSDELVYDEFTDYFRPDS